MTDAERATLAKELIRDEGTGPLVRGRFMPYKDSVGLLTIGYGRNLAHRGISLAEAHYLLLEDIGDVLAQVEAAFPWAKAMTPARQRVLANMCFNLGLHSLVGFKATLKAMEAGDYAAAAAGMRNSKWASQVGERAERLARMMERGE